MFFLSSRDGGADDDGGVEESAGGGGVWVSSLRCSRHRFWQEAEVILTNSGLDSSDNEASEKNHV